MLWDLFAKELDYFANAVDSPTKSVCGILGGARVADKIQLMLNLFDKVTSLPSEVAWLSPSLSDMCMECGPSCTDNGL